MEQSIIDYFIIQNKKKFTSQDLMLVRQRLEQLDDNATLQLQTIKFKNPTITLVFAWLLGSFGVDGFYSGKIGFGVAKLACYIVYMIFYTQYMKAFAFSYYYGYIGSVTSSLFFGIFGIAVFVLWIIGIVNASKWTRQYNYQKFVEATQAL